MSSSAARRQRAMAKKEAKKANANDRVHVTKTGLTIELRPVDPMFIQSVIRSVEMPDAPTYEVEVGLSGEKMTFPLDKEAAEQTGPEAIQTWKDYLNDLRDAQGAQADMSMRAILLDGTVAQEINDPVWIRRMRIIGMKISSDKEERWVDYLVTTLRDEIIDLSTKIMRLTGVSEEMIQDAEDTFRDSVLPDDGPGDVEDLESDEGDSS